MCERERFGYSRWETSGYRMLRSLPVYQRLCRLSTSGIYSSWSSGPQTSLTSFCRYIHFLSEFYFWSEFHFRFDVHTSTSPRSWPGYHGGGRSCTRTGHGDVGSVSPGAGTEPNSPDRSVRVRPTLRFGSESISVTGNYRQITYWLRKIRTNCWS